MTENNDLLIKKDGMYIVISGLSACGKTSFINKIKERQDARLVPSSSSLRDKTKKFDDISESYEATLKKQKYYFELDKSVSKIAANMKSQGGVVLGDRDFMSALSHNYAVNKKDPKISVYDWMAKSYAKALKSGELMTPDLHIFLDVPTNERKRRAEGEPSRFRDDCFFDEKFSSDMREFYQKALEFVPSKWIDYSDSNGVDRVIEAINSFDSSKQKSNNAGLIKFLNESAKNDRGNYIPIKNGRNL